MSKDESMQKYLSNHHETLRQVTGFMHEVVTLVGGDITLSQVLILIEVGRANSAGHPIEMKELEGLLGVASSSTFSRHVGTLLEYRSEDVPGLGLLEQKENRKDRRKKQLVLTDKGIKVLNSLSSYVVTVVRDAWKKTPEPKKKTKTKRSQPGEK